MFSKIDFNAVYSETSFSLREKVGMKGKKKRRFSRNDS